MSEHQGPAAVAKIVPIPKKYEAARPTVLPPGPYGPDALPDEIQRRAEALVLHVAHQQLGYMQALFEQNLQQQAQVFQQHAERMEAITMSLKEECAQYRHTAEGLVAQAREVQVHRGEATAVVFDPERDDDVPQLANMAIGGQEVAYTHFASDVAAEVRIAPTMVGRVAKALGLWNHPQYHAEIHCSANKTVSKYKKRAIAVMREFFEAPQRFGVLPGHQHWTLVKHFCNRNGLAIKLYEKAAKDSLFLAEPLADG
jgi:hypothetical protein